MTIDFYATRESYLGHLAPIWHALAPERRGACYVELGINELRPWAQDMPLARGRPPWEPTTDPVVVAGGGDIGPGSQGRPVVLLEHGAGQTYEGCENISYSGGFGRDQVRLFLTPNERTAARNSARYPDAEHVVVGAPSLDPYCRTRDLAGMPPPDDPIIAVTFHWRSRLGIPETRPAWEHYAATLIQIAARRSILGHSHPRAAHEFLPWWEKNGVYATSDYQAVLSSCQVLVADNTSALYEAARLDIPVVVLNAPWYRRDVEHGLRFWEMADVGIQVDRPDDLDAAITEALADPARLARRRAEIAREVFPYVGDVALARAVDAIETLGT